MTSTVVINQFNCNLCYPVLKVSPTFGNGMYYHAFGSSDIDLQITSDRQRNEEEFKLFLKSRELYAKVEWGDFNLNKLCCITRSDDKVEHLQSSYDDITAELCVRGLGKQPVFAKIASSTKVLLSAENDQPPLILAWNVYRHPYPEYLLELTISRNNEYTKKSKQLQFHHDILLRRVMHVLPPPNQEIQYKLEDVLWFPKMSLEHNTNNKDKNEASTHSFCCTCTSCFQNIEMSRSGRLTSHSLLSVSSSDNDQKKQRRRGFGIELETVQLQPDYEKGFFTKKDEFYGMIQHCAKIYRSNDSTQQYRVPNDAHGVGDPKSVIIPVEDNNDKNKHNHESLNDPCTTCKWDRLLLWQVDRDPQVWNAAPSARIDLYKKLQSLNDSFNTDIDSLLVQQVRDLVLGGGDEDLPETFLSTLPTIPCHSQTSPEYKSPLPPYELYHCFPPPPCGNDDAGCEISLLLDGVLKNDNNPYAAPILLPTISNIGQSSSSIHVHVNFNNSAAWPRLERNAMNDLQDTRSLLTIVFNWIRFDGVIRAFAREWMWRDRSLSPMFAAGPEFLWHEVAWKQGDTILDWDDDFKLERCNVPAFFHHAFTTYATKTDSSSETLLGNDITNQQQILFELVFDNEVLRKTLFRWCSLNLLSLKKYGTVEIRRMDATLDSKFVNAWTWFCVGFVEKFGDPKYFDKFGRPFLDDASNWREGLQNLIDAQNHATVEELIEIMTCPADPVVPLSTFSILTRDNFER